MAKNPPAATTHEAMVFGDSFRFAAQDERIPRYYIIVEAKKPAGLVEDVQNKIQEGWIPQGGIATQADKFCQALVKY